ncbi:MAG: ATP-binding protein [Propionibacteriaceae bacterium]|nr:ATP-binding protein [Propionibacteriaceae bacterium]
MVRAGAGTTSRLAINGEPAGKGLSPVAVILGANASGKSTILDAMSYVIWLIRTSARSEATKGLKMEPFLLDATSREEPFSTEICFTLDQDEYRYAFSLKDGKVESESLILYSSQQQRRSTRTLFTRAVSPQGKTEINVSNRLTGHKKAIIQSTRDNSLFLSKAAQDNYEPLMDVYRWFVESSPDDDDMTEDSVRRFTMDPHFRTWVTGLLTQADIGVMDVKIKTPSKPPTDLVDTFLRLGHEDENEEARHTVERRLIQQNTRPALVHQHAHDSGVDGELSWSRESLGTQELWRIAGPVFNALDTGRAFRLDEFENLHPLLIRAIIEIFQSASTNPQNAQLIFTSHDVSLLGNYGGLGYMLDRDQIWFTEKDNDGATELFPLSDYRPTKDEDIVKFYFQGRYGGIPVLQLLVDPAAD